MRVVLLLLLLAVPAFGQGHELAEPSVAASPRVAWNDVVAGTNEFLAWWIDRGHDGIFRFEIVAIDRTGHRLSEPRTVLETARPDAATVIGFGSSFGLFLTLDGQTRYTRFSPAGSILSTAIFPMPRDRVSIAGDAETICIVTQGPYGNPGDITASWFDLDGNLRRRAVVDHTGVGTAQTTVLSDGAGEFVIARREQFEVTLRRFDDDGNPLAAVAVATAPLQYADVAAHHDSLLLHGPTDREILSFAVTRDGVRSAAQAFQQRRVPGFDYRLVALPRGGYMLVYAATTDATTKALASIAIAADGTAGSATTFASATDPFSLSVAALDDTAFVTFLESNQLFREQPRFEGCLAAPASTVEVLGIAPADQLPVDVIPAGTGFLVAWMEDGAGKDAAKAALVDRGGARIAPAFPILSEAVRSPRLATNGSMHLIAADAGGIIRVARFRSDGTVLDTTPITVATGYLPLVASDGRDFLIVWRTPSAYGLQAARIDAATGMVTTPLALVPEGGSVRLPRELVWDGSEYVLGYGTETCLFQFFSCTLLYDAWTLRLGPNGAPSGMPSKLLPDGYLLALASDGHGETLAIGWRDGQTLAVFQRGSAAPTMPSRIFSWPVAAEATAAFDGADYVVLVTTTVELRRSHTLVRVRRNGTAQIDGTLSDDTPAALGATSGGASLIVTSQPRAGSPSLHAVAYTPSELPPALAPPEPPATLLVVGRAPANVMWTGGDGATAAVIDQHVDGAWRTGYPFVPAANRIQVEALFPDADFVRVRLMNAAGTSLPSPEAVPIPRTHRRP